MCASPMYEGYITEQAANAGQSTNPFEQSSAEVRDLFREQLKRGYWLQISEQYMSRGKWTLERVARDGWQNFFDANGYTLDGIGFSVTEDENGSAIEIKLDGANYDFKRLLAFGVGHKEDTERAAGGESEGTRIMALHMLRDFGFKQVKFASQDWELEFYLDAPPEGSVPQDKEQLRYLYARLQDRPMQDGNSVRFRADNPQAVEAFVRAKDLFRHSGNEDFAHPDMETDCGGFKFHQDKTGNFYLNGQRIAYEEADKWETVSGFTFWSNRTPRHEGRALHTGRDRQLVTRSDLLKIYFPFLVESLSTEELEEVVALLEPIFEEKSYGMSDVGASFLKSIVETLEKKGFKFNNFSSHDVAGDLRSEQMEILKGMGYRICHPFLATIGMLTASELLEEIKQLNLIEKEDLTQPEIQRMSLISGFAEKLLKETESPSDALLSRELKIVAKEMALFRTRHPLEGRYDKGEVFVRQNAIHDPDPSRALSTYLHELCHKFGPDESAQFSYALTDLQERLLRFAMNNPMAMAELKEQWEAVQMESLIAKSWHYYEFDDFIAAMPETNARQKALAEAYMAQSHKLEAIFSDRLTDNFDFSVFLQTFQDIESHPDVKAMKDFFTATEQPEELTQEEKDALKAERAEFGQELSTLRNEIHRVISELKSTSKAKRKKILKDKLMRLEKERDEKRGAYDAATKKLRAAGDDFDFHRFTAINRQLKDATFGNVRYVDLSELSKVEVFVGATIEVCKNKFLNGRMSTEELEVFLSELSDFIDSRKIKESIRLIILSELRDLHDKMHKLDKSGRMIKPLLAFTQILSSYL